MLICFNFDWNWAKKGKYSLYKAKTQNPIWQIKIYHAGFIDVYTAHTKINVIQLVFHVKELKLL